MFYRLHKKIVDKSAAKDYTKWSQKSLHLIIKPQRHQSTPQRHSNRSFKKIMSSCAVHAVTSILLMLTEIDVSCCARAINQRTFGWFHFGFSIFSPKLCLWPTLVEEHQQHSTSPPGLSAPNLKHGNGSGGKFLSVPGKHSFGKNWNKMNRVANCIRDGRWMDVMIVSDVNSRSTTNCNFIRQQIETALIQKLFKALMGTTHAVCRRKIHFRWRKFCCPTFHGQVTAAVPSTTSFFNSTAQNVYDCIAGFTGMSLIDLRKQHSRKHLTARDKI